MKMIRNGIPILIRDAGKFDTGINNVIEKIKLADAKGWEFKK